MFRNLALILFGAFALFFLIDFLYVYNAHMKIEKAVEQALDGAIIASTQVMENQRGRLEPDEAVAEGAVRDILVDNLKLDSTSNLTNDHFSNSSLNVSITYLDTVPRIECQFHTDVKLIAGKMFGLDAYPLTINRYTPYLGEFK